MKILARKLLIASSYQLKKNYQNKKMFNSSHSSIANLAVFKAVSTSKLTMINGQNLISLVYA